MIIKQATQSELPNDPRLRAGIEAERQMALYLHRAFAHSQDLYVVNDLRLVDGLQPDPSGAPGVCQIDHLVIHRWGMFIVESKSVTEEILIRPDRFGGDEWSRKYKGREEGMPSAIQQANRQGEFLRTFLQRSRESLLGKVTTGLGTISKLLHGTDQRGFGALPIQVIVAISDHGRIARIGGWKEPEGEFSTIVCKADLVTDRISAEFARHREGAPLLSGAKETYGHWGMLATEVPAVAAFLNTRHTPPYKTVPAKAIAPVSPSLQRIQPRDSLQATSNSATIAPARPACKSCSSENLHAASGKYGYYWKCAACQTNTAMPTVCDACGAAGRGPGKVRIRKDGPNYWRECAQCNMSEKIWVER